MLLQGKHQSNTVYDNICKVQKKGKRKEWKSRGSRSSFKCKHKIIWMNQWNELGSILHILGEPGGSQSGREKRRNESFQVRTEEPRGTDSHRTISKSSSRCRLLIGHKKCFVLLCPIGEHISWVLFVCSYTTAIARLVGVMHQRNARSQETFSLI